MKTGTALAATCALAAAATLSSWRMRHPLPEGVAGGVATFRQGKLLYAGGTTWRSGEKIWLSTTRLFDPSANRWKNGPELPEALAYGPALDGPLGFEIFGGLNGDGPSRHIWRLSKTGAPQWEKSGELTFPTGLGSAAAAAGRVYLFGGCADAASLTSCTQSVMARGEDGRWIEAGQLPGGPFALAATAAVADRVYLFGGCRPTGPASIQNLNAAWCFSPSSLSWRALRPLPISVRGMSALALEDGGILLAGGYHATAEEAQRHGPEYGFSSAVWLYHPDRDTYEPVAPLPYGITGLGLARLGRSVFGVGGEDRPRSRTPVLMEASTR